MLEACPIQYLNVQTPKILRYHEHEIPAYKTRTRIILNVGGMRFETFEETLNNHPETLLGSSEKRRLFFDCIANEYIIPRDKNIFDSILFYYQSNGIISRPCDIEKNAFEAECKFYQIQYQEEFSDDDDDFEMETSSIDDVPESPLRRKLWLFLERPESSKYAHILAYASLGMIIFSISIFCLETVPELQHKCHRNNFKKQSQRLADLCKNYVDVWFILEMISISWFTVEYCLRIFASRSSTKFMFSSMGIIDIAAILPFYITLALERTTFKAQSFSVIRAIRLFRVLRIFKLSRYSENLKILALTIYDSLDQLKSLVLCLFLTIVLYSGLMYYVEVSGGFESIPATFWYTIITMTTVGYGDVVPRTLAGQLVGTACAVSGVILFCLPTPILVSKFLKYYLKNGRQGGKAQVLAENLKELFLATHKRK